ncbi:MAG: integrase, partial [Caulobacteraceae bacterium]|nr:integrase [Caulobacteraceae bacterium]
MKRELPAYCYLRHGRYVYFERRGQKAKRITAELGTPEFWAQYAVLMKGGPPPATRRDFNALVRSYRLSSRFNELSDRTRADYDRVLVWMEQKLGPLPVAGLQRRHVIEARDVNAEKSSRFADYIVQVVSVVMEYAIDLGWRDDGTNPAKGVSKIGKKKAQRQPWPQDLIQAFRAAAGPRALLIF